jgi:hypothetical protein
MECMASPLFPAANGRVANKAAVVATFEAIGTLLGQPLLSETGIRLFGGHSPRVTGAQVLTAAGVEVNKVRILARHSGEAILRYVSDAPLRSIRADLGGHAARTSLGSAPASLAALDTNAKLRKLEMALAKVQADVQTQAQDVLALATGYARTDDRVFVQNSVTATVHLALKLDGGHAACGWRFSTARRPATGPAFRVITSLTNLPGMMLCERCLPTERAVALSASNAADIELSGDES